MRSYSQLIYKGIYNYITNTLQRLLINQPEFTVFDIECLIACLFQMSHSLCFITEFVLFILENFPNLLEQVFFHRNSSLKFPPIRCAKGSRPSYCLACLFSLVEQVRKLSNLAYATLYD